MFRLMRWLALTIAIFLAGCGDSSKAPQSNANSADAAATNSAATKTNRYQAKGVVREIVSPTRARIAHEAIPGYMPAMVMPLDAKNTNELANVKVGDQISFDLVVTGDDGWIEKVTRLGQTNAVAQAGETNEVPHFRQVRDVDPLGVGDQMPDYPFVTAEGNPIKLSDLKGQAIGITFFFTRCPFPTYCPRMSSNFEKIAAELSKQGSPTNWHLLSISFDPEFDTPERLNDYAKRYKPEPAKWNFVTGKMIDIDAITEQFGLVFARRNGSIDHNLRSVIVDATGKITQIYIGNEWDVNEFATEMKKAAEAKPGVASTPSKP